MASRYEFSYYYVIWKCMEWEQKYMKSYESMLFSFKSHGLWHKLWKEDSSMSSAHWYSVFAPMSTFTRTFTHLHIFPWWYLEFFPSTWKIYFSISSKLGQMMVSFLWLKYEVSIPSKAHVVKAWFLPCRWCLYRKYWKFQNMGPRWRRDITGIQIPFYLFLWFLDDLI